MMIKVWQFIQHKRTVHAWERDLQKKANTIAKQCGYKKNSYDYQWLLHEFANEE